MEEAIHVVKADENASRRDASEQKVELRVPPKRVDPLAAVDLRWSRVDVHGRPERDVADAELYAKLDQFLDCIAGRIRHAIILVDANLQILWRNDAADRLLRTADMLYSKRGQLRVVGAGEMSRLRGLVLAAAKTRCVPTAETVLPLRCRDTERFCELVLCPASCVQDPETGKRTGAALIFVSDPEQPTSVPLATLKSLFGLTLCEARLARSLLNGMNLEDYAEEEAHISLNTARTHLKSVFRKTNTRSQACLVTLLSRLVPALDLED